MTLSLKNTAATALLVIFAHTGFGQTKYSSDHITSLMQKTNKEIDSLKQVQGKFQTYDSVAHKSLTVLKSWEKLRKDSARLANTNLATWEAIVAYKIKYDSLKGDEKRTERTDLLGKATTLQQKFKQTEDSAIVVQTALENAFAKRSRDKTGRPYTEEEILDVIKQAEAKIEEIQTTLKTKDEYNTALAEANELFSKTIDLINQNYNLSLNKKVLLDSKDLIFWNNAMTATAKSSKSDEIDEQLTLIKTKESKNSSVIKKNKDDLEKEGLEKAVYEIEEYELNLSNG